MSYDGMFTHKVVNELTSSIQNGRISKIYQPFTHEILLTIRANRKNQKLYSSKKHQYYISAQSGYAQRGCRYRR